MKRGEAEIVAPRKFVKKYRNSMKISDIDGNMRLLPGADKVEITGKGKVLKIHPVTRVLAILLCLLYLASITTFLFHLDEINFGDFNIASDWWIFVIMTASLVYLPMIFVPVAVLGRPPKFLNKNGIDLIPIEALKIANSRFFNSAIFRISISIALWTFLFTDFTFFRCNYWQVNLANTRESGPGYMIGLIAAFGMPLVTVIGWILFLMKKDMGRFLLPTGIAFILLKDYQILFLPCLSDPGYYLTHITLGIAVVCIFAVFYHDVFWYRIKNRRRRIKGSDPY